MRRSAFVLAVGLGLVAGAARAELYKCKGPDGKTLFTSDRSQCPGAEVHEPSGQLQRTRPSSATPPASPRTPTRPASGASDDEGEAQVWRAKRVNAKTALKQTEAELEMLHEVAGWCNRGHEVWAEDRDGLRHGVDCEDVDQKERELRREQKRLEAYLAEGLEEECRRAGCLPGWMR
jgi:uncharacterized protein DUF4124